MADGFKPCSVDGCNANAHWRARGKRGYCNAHYARWLRHGDPLGGISPPGVAAKWLNDVAMSHTDSGECLIWPFYRSGNGYASIWRDGKKRPVCRIICTELYGPPPTDTHQAAHSCGKGHLGCVNPKHLRWATRVQNAADQVKHGTVQRGERQWRSKITERDARLIRRMAETHTQGAIGKKFGISRSNVGYIIRRKTWAWLP